MNVLEIVAQRKTEEGWPIVAEFNESGAFLPRRWEGLLNVDEVNLIERQVNPLAYGTILGQALFQGSIRDALMAARTISPERLRILLVIEAPDLRHWHWENLCGPIGVGGKWRHLAIDQRTLFSLYLPSLSDRRFPAIGSRDLRALVVVSNPAEGNIFDLASFDEAGTIAGVRRSLGDIPHEVLGSVDGVDGKPTINEISARITDQHYTILHLVAHGWYRADNGETVIYLLDDEGAVKPITATAFIDRLQALQGARGLPHLAFLCTCESASPEAEREGALGGLGQRLVRELGMPAVIAMTKRVSIATATHLSYQFYKRLKVSGEVARALVEAGVELAEAGDITVAALYERLAGRPLFSDSLDRELTAKEIAYGLERMARLWPERAPVLQEELDRNTTVLRASLGADKVALSAQARQEWEEALLKINALCETVLDLNFRALSLGQEPPAYNSACPFPGLAAFQPDDRRYFFGREKIVNLLVERLAEHPFLAVLGASGSGKSSLVLAGLVPALQEKQPNLKMVYLTPGNDPLANLEHALTECQPEAILVVDQFEEVFTLGSDLEVRKQFVDRLLGMFQGASPIKVVITMRADFWGECAAFPKLRLAMQQHQELLAAMTTGELRAAMERQAAAVGLKFVADLSNTILDEVEEEPGAMPLLQHLLRELWKRRHGRWLLLEEYKAVGGIRKALAQTAEEIYAALLAEKETPEEKQALESDIRNIFLRLTRVDTEAIAGERRRDTRQRVTVSALVTRGADAAEIKRLIDRLVAARLVRINLNPASDEIEVEVTHEALILHWARLVSWIDDNIVKLRLRSSIGQAAKEWRKHSGAQQAFYLVHQGGRLEDAEALRLADPATLNELEHAYLDACVEIRDRKAREREARNLVFVANDLLDRDLTKAVRMAQLAHRLDRYQALPQVSRALSTTYGRAMCNRAAFYVAELPHKAEVTAVATSADGQKIVTASRDGTAKLWGQRGELLATMVQGDEVLDAAIAPDGSRIVTVGFQHLVKMWDGDGQFVRDLVGHGSHRWPDTDSVAFSPDGEWIVTAGADHTAILWTKEGELCQQLTDHDNIIRFVTFSPQGDHFLTCGVWEDSAARLYERQGKTATLIAVLGLDEAANLYDHGWQRGLTHGAFSPDGELIVTTSRDRTVKLWSGQGSHLKTLRDHAGVVYQVAFAPDGSYFVTVSEDKTAIIWDREGNVQRRITDSDAAALRVAISKDSQYIASGEANGSVKIWDRRGRLLGNLVGHQAAINRVTFAPDGQTVLTASRDRSAKIWMTIPPRQTTFQHKGEVVSAHFLPGMTEVLTSSHYKDAHDDEATELVVRRWDLRTGAVLSSYEGFSSDFYNNWRIFSLDVAPDGRRFVTTSTDYHLRIWDIASGQIIAQQRTDDWQYNKDGWMGLEIARYSPDGQMIIGGDFGGMVKVWSAEGELRFEWPEAHPDEVAAVAISPDNKLAVTGSHDKLIRLWDLEKGEKLRQLEGHTGPILDLRFSADGQNILSASMDYTAKLWDLEGNLLLDLDRHAGEVRSAVFAPDGQTILTAAHDGLAIIWDLKGRVANTLRGHAKYLRSAHFSPDGRSVITASGDGTARLWPLDEAIAAELEARFSDIYRLTVADLQAYDLDVAVCGPFLEEPN